MADNPIHIPAVFAVNGLKNVIQKVRQVGQAIQDFTWVDGTPAVTMIDKDDGGLAPKGQDFNGVLNALSEHTVFNQNGGRYKWSQDVIDNYGGYSKDFIIQSDNGQTEWISLVDNNTRNPNNGLGSDWKIYAGQGSVPVASSTTAGITRVLNVLTSTDITAAASAATVKLLNDTKLAIGDVVNNLTTTSTNRALSANMGKTLNDSKVAISSIVNSLTSTATNQPLSAAMGKLLSDRMLGVGQTWQNVTSSRSLGTTYTNNTSRPIEVSISLPDTGSQNPTVTINVGGVNILVNTYDLGQGSSSFSHSFTVPAGATYRISVNISVSITTWAELR